MRECITTISSLIIIACCFCSLLSSEELDVIQSSQSQNSDFDGQVSQCEKPVSRSKLFKRVLAVNVKNEVLMFVTLEEEGGLREHYFQLRNRNVILCNQGDMKMPLDSIKFAEDGANTIIVSIPPGHEVDLMEALTFL